MNSGEYPSQAAKTSHEPLTEPRSETKSNWSSLEVAKLLSGVMTPIVVLVMGYIINQTLSDQNRRLAEQNRIQKAVLVGRTKIFDSIREDLAHIYDYIEDIGTWKEDNPDTIIADKLKIDTAMWSERPFWSETTFNAYEEYMKTAFDMSAGGVGKDAPIKTDLQGKQSLPSWKAEWQSRLTGERDPDHRSKYKNLQDLFFQDLTQ